MDTSNQLYKADAGKLEARLFFEGMPKTIKMLIAVLSYGAQKYEAHSWKTVETDRYRDAKIRHQLDAILYGGVDTESGLPHEAHEIINAMFIFEQLLDDFTEDEFEEMLKFNKPPQDHKK